MNVIVHFEHAVELLHGVTRFDGLTGANGKGHHSVVREALQCLVDHVLVSWVTEVSSALYQYHLKRR